MTAFLMPDITICSVYHSADSKALLEMNEELTARLNPDAAWIWLVADNTPEEKRIPVDPRRFTVARGIDRAVLECVFVPPIVNTYHHSLALNGLMPFVQTRFLLSLDSDFFIIRRGWIHEVLSYMQKNNLAAFGATWHPRYINKIRYAPTHYCLFIDGEKMDISGLDFTPAFLSHEMFVGKNPHGTFPRKGGERAPVSFLARAARNIIGRKDIETSRDTGYAISKKLLAGGLPYECLQSVFKPAPPRPLMRMVNAVIPDRWSYIPQKRGYFSEEGFRENGLIDFYQMGMEEYLWRGEPFATHIRNVWKRSDISEELAILRQWLAEFS